MRLLPWFGRRGRAERRAQRQPVMIDAAMRIDADAICPDCLQWIGPTDHVRRNAYGIVEHDTCPPVSATQRHR